MEDNIIRKKDRAYQALKEDIVKGKWLHGDRLPIEKELCKEIDVSIITLRVALKKLEEEGLIIRIRGRGTFVNTETKQQGSNLLILSPTIDTMEDPYRYIMPSLNTKAFQNNCHCIPAESDFVLSLSASEFQAYIKKNNVLSIILCMSTFNGDEPILTLLNAVDIPVIIPHANINDAAITGFACISLDVKAAWEKAIAHLAEQGHINVATLGKKDSVKSLRVGSLSEHLGLLERHGLCTDKSLVKINTFNATDIKEAINHWMKSENPPTAILCFSDFFAIHVYKALKDLNLRIPQDVAVMGFCGFPGAKLLYPPLSTVDFHYDTKGEKAVDMALQSDKWFKPGSDYAAPQIRQATTLIERKSTKIKRSEKLFRLFGKLNG